MEWYWWALIVVGAAAIGVLKLKFYSAWMKKRKERNQPIEDE